MAANRLPRDQYLDLAKGIPSDYLLQYNYIPNPYSQRMMMCMYSGPSFLSTFRGPQGGKDVWGVPYITTRETGYSAIPEPNNFILKDITKWRDVIKAPDITGYDWEQMARNDFAFLGQLGVDHTKTAMLYLLHGGYFQQLMAFMGFTEGLCAIQEEPEEVYALMDYLCSFYTEIAKKSIDYYKPDVYQIIDDTAAWGAPFISVEQYRTLFKPFAAREAQFGIDRGLPVAMHCCGKCESLIDDWRDFGVRYWEPAQTCNDLVGIQQKYGNEIIVCGGFEMKGDLVAHDLSEEQFKQKVRDRIDQLTQNAFYIFDGWDFAAPDDAEANNRNRWITEVIEGYGLTHYYKG